MCYGSFVHQLCSLTSSQWTETQNFPSQITENFRINLKAAPPSKETWLFPTCSRYISQTCSVFVCFYCKMWMRLNITIFFKQYCQCSPEVSILSHFCPVFRNWSWDEIQHLSTLTFSRVSCQKIIIPGEQAHQNKKSASDFSVLPATPIYWALTTEE